MFLPLKEDGEDFWFSEPWKRLSQFSDGDAIRAKPLIYSKGELLKVSATKSVGCHLRGPKKVVGPMGKDDRTSSRDEGAMNNGAATAGHVR